MRRDVRELWNLVEPHVVGAGFDLCELDWGREGGRWVLRVYIDRVAPPAGAVDLRPAGVGHEECERVSRDLSAILDVADKIPHAYTLEVSSPGLERPLRRPEDFARFTGQRAKVRLHDGLDGRRNFSGTLRGVHDGLVDLDCDGTVHALPISDVARAHLIADWQAAFKKQPPAAPRSAST